MQLAQWPRAEAGAGLVYTFPYTFHLTEAIVTYSAFQVTCNLRIYAVCIRRATSSVAVRIYAECIQMGPKQRKAQRSDILFPARQRPLQCPTAEGVSIYPALTAGLWPWSEPQLGRRYVRANCATILTLSGKEKGPFRPLRFSFLAVGLDQIRAASCHFCGRSFRALATTLGQDSVQMCLDTFSVLRCRKQSG